MDAKQLLLLISHSCCCIDCLRKQMPQRQFFPQSMRAPGNAEESLWDLLLVFSSLSVIDYGGMCGPYGVPENNLSNCFSYHPPPHTHITNRKVMLLRYYKTYLTAIVYKSLDSRITQYFTADNTTRIVRLKTPIRTVRSKELNMSFAKGWCISFSKTIIWQSRWARLLKWCLYYEKSQEYDWHLSWSFHRPPLPT